MLLMMLTFYYRNYLFYEIFSTLNISNIESYSCDINFQDNDLLLCYKLKLATNRACLALNNHVNCQHHWTPSYVEQ